MTEQSEKWYAGTSALFFYVGVPILVFVGYMAGGEGESGPYRADWLYALMPLTVGAIPAYWVMMPLSYKGRATAASFYHAIAFSMAFYAGYVVDYHVEGMAGMMDIFAPVVIVGIVAIGAVSLWVVRSVLKWVGKEAGCLQRQWKWGVCFAGLWAVFSAIVYVCRM